MTDQNLTVKTAGPTSAGTANSTALDFGSPDGVGNLAGKVRFKLEVPAIVGLSDTKTQIFTLQDSADNSTFTAVAAYPAVTFTGAGGAGAAAADAYFEWTPSLRRYLRVQVVTAATPGTITAYNYFLKALDGNNGGL
jgi:hypothetical protein